MYKWALTGYVEQPVKITEQQLIGIPILAQKIPDCIPERLHGEDFNRAVTTPFYPRLYLVPFISCHVLSKTFYDGVAVFQGVRVVGYSVDDVTYIVPEFQNKGIGAELLCEKYLYYNVLEKRANREIMSKAYTENGLKVIKRAYRLLLERGAIYG